MSMASGASKVRTVAGSLYPGRLRASSDSTLRFCQRIERMFAESAVGFAPQGHNDAAGAAVIPVLAEVDALPGAEGELAVPDGHRERVAGERALDVGGHVVGPLEGVGPVGGVLRNGLVEPGAEVASHVGAGVLVEGERRRGVAHE